MTKTKEEIKKAEEEFQIVLKKWRETKDENAWLRVWELVQDCCSNICKQRLKGVRCPDFEGKVLDSTMNVIKKIKDGIDPKKLSSFCYMYTLDPLYRKQTKYEERAISFEGYIEENGDCLYSQIEENFNEQ